MQPVSCSSWTPSLNSAEQGYHCDFVMYWSSPLPPSFSTPSFPPSLPPSLPPSPPPSLPLPLPPSLTSGVLAVLHPGSAGAGATLPDGQQAVGRRSQKYLQPTREVCVKSCFLLPSLLSSFLPLPPLPSFLPPSLSLSLSFSLFLPLFPPLNLTYPPSHTHRCFDEDKKSQLLDNCDMRLLKRLVICIIKVKMCTVVKSESTPTDTLVQLSLVNHSGNAFANNYPSFSFLLDYGYCLRHV